jgi:hypothetical protein
MAPQIEKGGTLAANAARSCAASGCRAVSASHCPVRPNSKRQTISASFDASTAVGESGNTRHDAPSADGDCAWTAVMMISPLSRINA